MFLASLSETNCLGLTEEVIADNGLSFKCKISNESFKVELSES